jgi:hypothetical protein
VLAGHDMRGHVPKMFTVRIPTKAATYSDRKAATIPI